MNLDLGGKKELVVKNWRERAKYPLSSGKKRGRGVQGGNCNQRRVNLVNQAQNQGKGGTNQTRGG